MTDEQRAEIQAQIDEKQAQIEYVQGKRAVAYAQCSPDMAESHCAVFDDHLTRLGQELADLEAQLAG